MTFDGLGAVTTVVFNATVTQPLVLKVSDVESLLDKRLKEGDTQVIIQWIMKMMRW